VTEVEEAIGLSDGGSDRATEVGGSDRVKRQEVI